jgi:hypothetical protein
MSPLRASALASLLLVAGCADGEPAKSPCEQHVDRVIDQRLADAPVPAVGDDQLADELDKHRAALTAAHGDRLLRDCEKREGSR